MRWFRGPILLLIASLSLATAASATWNLTSIRDRRNFNLSSSRFDPAGNPAIAFGAGSLYYAAWNGSAWDLQTVARGCAGERGASLSFDGVGRPAISYHDDAGALQLARWNGATWAIEVVDASVVVDGATSLALDGTGNPAIAYHDATNDDLRYASSDGTTWTVTTVDGGAGRVGEYLSLAMDAAGRPAIGYHDHGNRDLKLARFDGSAWRLEVVDGMLDDGRWASLAFDGSGNPGLSYAEGSAPADIKYAHWNGSSWDLEYVMVSTSVLAGTSLGFDGGGNPGIAYFSDFGGPGAVYYAVKTGPSAWSSRRADPAVGTGAFPSLAFDLTGNPGISYIDIENYTIKFTRLVGPAFSPEHVVGYGPWGGISIAFDGADQPAVSFGDGTLGGLQLARFDGSSWTVGSVDPGFWAGSASSLRFDGSGNPVIAYDDRATGVLKLARWNGTSWVLEVVDGPSSDPTAPMAPSLAMDAAGRPAVSYNFWSGSSFSLKLARWTGTAWTREVVVPDISTSFDNPRTLGFDGSGNPAIVYLKGLPEELRFTIWNGTTWDDQLVESAAVGAFGPTFAFDGAGTPTIVYSATGPAVKLAWRSGAIWRNEIVDSGYAGSVAIDPAGNPVVSYGGVTTVLRLARWDGVAWSYETVTSGIERALAISPSGKTAIVYGGRTECDALAVALSGNDAAVHRGVVGSFTPGWQSAALPLISLNDDQTPPFPAPTGLPGASPTRLPRRQRCCSTACCSLAMSGSATRFV